MFIGYIKNFPLKKYDQKSKNFILFYVKRICQHFVYYSLQDKTKIYGPQQHVEFPLSG